jgi:CRP-like cAMP-binding protein
VCGGVGYPGTATATEDSLAIGWSKAATQALMERHPRVAVNALGAMGRRMQEAHVRLREMATEPVGRRIAHTLVRLVAQAGRQGPKGIEIDFPMTRQDLAEMAGTTLHTVSRTLSAWEEAGVVESRRRRVIVRDPAALAQLAEEPARG